MMALPCRVSSAFWETRGDRNARVLWERQVPQWSEAVNGAKPYDEFAKVINAELTRLKIPIPAAASKNPA
jgi:hypothetical protein